MDKTIKHILFPTDYSTAAENAFKYCFQFAEKLDAEISLLHIYTLPVIDDINLPKRLQGIYDKIHEEEKEKFQRMIAPIKEIVKGVGAENVKINYLLHEGRDIPEIIVEKCKELGADLIVMGTQGATLIEKYFLGNNTSNVMEYAEVPVLGIPPNAILPEAFTDIVVCTDYSDDDKQVLKILKTLFPGLSDKMVTLHVDIAGKAVDVGLEKGWKEFAEAEQVIFRNLKGNTFLHGIQEYDDKYGIDILAMRTHNRRAILNIFNRYTAKNLIYSKTVPLLAMPEKAWMK